MSTLTIYTDGGARGNPGPAAVGVYFKLGQFEERHHRTIGTATNNVAEYTAVLDALTKVAEYRQAGAPVFSALHFFLDSELVVKQLRGEYRIKEPTLQGLALKAKLALKELDLPFQFSHVKRESNKIADSLVNAALDAAQAI